MHLPRINMPYKTNPAIASALKNTSCSHGWLRLMVQCIFGVITVASFILILLMSVSSGNPSPSRCSLHGCRVVCTEVPYNSNFEDDIVFAVADAETTCNNVFLTLNKPVFEDGTLPKEWLSQMGSHVHELAIIGGNLKHISPHVFMTPHTRNIEHLVLENIVITTWVPDILVGLSSLKELTIKHSKIIEIRSNGLEAVDDTLRSLTITMTGRWNPKNLTGSANLKKLSTVVFSSNDFGSILRKDSFAELRHCRKLYLNSCQITAIGEGTFDSLLEIEVIYLNNNFLATVPPGLFHTLIVNPNMPRINLKENPWVCDCNITDLRQLAVNGMMLVDPVCYYPENIRYLSLLDFEKHCTSLITRETRIGSINLDFGAMDISDYEYINTFGVCLNASLSYNRAAVRLVSLIDKFKCSSSGIRSINKTIFSPINELKNELLQPTFAIKVLKYSMLELRSRGSDSYGLVWYQSDCPNEIYCLNILPNYLRVFNLDAKSQYTFCPLSLTSGLVEGDKCVYYKNRPADFSQVVNKNLRLLFYIGTAISCLVVGALCLYAIIRKFPSLLKGSSRILFVKHKNVDALILPPKVPLRTVLSGESAMTDFNEKDIFIVPSNQTFVRTKSLRSSKSGAPSYISALQPTEDQLAEWRLRHHFDNNLTFPSMSLASYRLDDDYAHLSLDQHSNKTYESF